MSDIFGFVGIVIGLLGIFIGIVLVLTVNVLRSCSNLKKDVLNMAEEVQKLGDGSYLFSPNLFVVSLAREAKFWAKLAIHRADKVLIAHTIVSKFIKEGQIVILDSGTTIDQVAHILHERHCDITIYTNNLLAAISIITPVERFKCYLLSGKVDPIYGATYNVGNVEEPLRQTPAHVIVLAAAAISFDGGPMVGIEDHPNRLFKRELVRKAMEDTTQPILVIAVDWTKFAEPVAVNGKERFNPVLDKPTWREVKATSRFVLVTTKPLSSEQTNIAVTARNEIMRFTMNMESRSGMQVIVCET